LVISFLMFILINFDVRTFSKRLPDIYGNILFEIRT
jgi:hypothetical protein